MQVIINAETNVGKVRTNNEDSFIAEPIWGGTHYLVVVIDGVGGYEGGEVAAQIATEKIKGYLVTDAKGEPGTLLKEAVIYANTAIYNARKDSRKYSEMCCVLTACLIDVGAQQVYMAHVGDTRLYIYHQGVLKKLSHDHSLVGYREEIGNLSEAEAMEHPQRNVINRNVGSELHKVDDENFIEAGVFPIEGESVYLLCSDGLNDMITSGEITRCLKEAGTVAEKCSRLVHAALDAGGRDNITVVVAHVLPEVKNEGAAAIAAGVNVPESTVVPPDAVVAPGPAGQKQPQKTEDDKKHVSAKGHARRRPVGAYLICLLLGMLLGSLACFFVIVPGKFSPVNKPPGILPADAAKPVIKDAAFLYFSLDSAQKTAKHQFSYTPADSVIKIDRPLVIYADSFEWVQPSVLHIRPADSASCPVGLIIHGRDVKLKNVYFGHFEKDTIVIRNSKPALAQKDKQRP